MRIKPFTSSIESIIWRYYLLMFVVVGSFVAGYPAIALLAVPIFLSALLGIGTKTESKRKAKQVTMPAVVTQRDQAA